jgi:hypothetical protein
MTRLVWWEEAGTDGRPVLCSADLDYYNTGNRWWDLWRRRLYDVYALAEDDWFQMCCMTKAIAVRFADSSC